MLSRLLVIVFLLFLPIAIALVSQHMARTVAPPMVDNKVVKAELRAGRAPQAASAGGLPESYRPRSVKSVHPVEEEVIEPEQAASSKEEADK